MVLLAAFFITSLLGLVGCALWMRLAPRSPQRQENACRMAREHLVNQNGASAERVLRPFVHAECSHPGLLHLYAKALCLQGNGEKALGVLCYFAPRFPHHLGLQGLLGHLLVERGAAAEALPHLLRAEPALRRESQRLDLGLAWFQTGQVEKAWEAIEATLAHTTLGHLLALAGDCRFHHGDIEESLTYYRRALVAGWVNESLLFRLGYGLRLMGQTVEARRYLRLILQRDPDHPPATLELAKCFQKEGEWGRALATLQSSPLWEEEHPQIMAKAGYCAARMGSHEEAEQWIKLAIRQGHRAMDSLATLAYAYEGQRQWELAEQVYHELVHRYPTHVAGYRGLSWLFGVGLSVTLDAETGLAMAYQALDIRDDARSWELVSACEARAGHFHKACHIQEKLAHEEQDPILRERRLIAVGALRKGLPLDETHVAKALVA